MTTTFDISSQQQRRTFKERLSDIHQTSIAGGLFNILLFLILLIPLIVLAIGESFYKSITGQGNKTTKFIQKEYLIDSPTISIKAIDLTDREFYAKLKKLYNLTEDEIDSVGNACFIKSEPQVDYFTDKLYTRRMTEFGGGIIVQEINFENWTSKLIFLELPSLKTEIIKELDYTYDLTFEKTNEHELKIVMRRPGDKGLLLVKKN